MTVAVAGLNTHFTQGVTTASVGAGITVVSLTVNSATSAMAVLNIDPSAPIGPSNVTLTTGAEVVTLANGFAVAAGTPVLTQVNPNTGQQGQQGESVAIAGQYTHFAQGTTTASFGSGITVASLTVNSATSATAVVNIDPAAATGARNVTLTTGAEVATLANGFTVTAGTPVLTQINPNTGQLGQQNAPIVLAGQYTHFSPSSVVSFGNAGVTAAAPTSATATSLTVPVSVTPTDAIGATSVTVTTLGEVVTLNNAFTVTESIAAISSLIPASGAQGQTGLQVTINGTGTHFDSTSSVSFGQGVTPTAIQVVSAYGLVATIITPSG